MFSSAPSFKDGSKFYEISSISDVIALLDEKLRGKALALSENVINRLDSMYLIFVNYLHCVL